IRNPKPETRNTIPETRNPIPETRYPKPGTRNPKPDTRTSHAKSGEQLPWCSFPFLGFGFRVSVFGKGELHQVSDAGARNTQPEMRNPKPQTLTPDSTRQMPGCRSVGRHAR
ncbi:hypothetical protein T484DRAFT_1629257, partial [Baffinella frigidus]